MRVRGWNAAPAKLLLIGLALHACLSSTVRAADAPPVVETPSAPPATSSETKPDTPLPSRQEAVALRYSRFENSLNQLAEHLRKTDPDRADLLFRAIGKSKEGRISDQLKQVVDLLKKEQLGDALDGQQSAVEQMLIVLQLLQSEDRKDEIEREKQRIAGLIKDVDKLVLKQTDVRAATERGGNTDSLKDKQKQVSDATQKVLDKIDQQDAQRNQKSSDSDGKSKSNPKDSDKDDATDKSDEPMPKEGDKDKPADAPKDGSSGKGKPKSPMKDGDSKQDDQPKKDDPNKTEDGKMPDEKDADDKDSEKSDGSPMGKPNDSAKKPPKKGPKSKPMPGESQPPMDGQPMPPMDDEGQESPQPQPQSEQDQRQQQKTPGRQELEQARKEMENAIEELKKKSGKASEKQDEALADLLKAKERLEAILRQLREEEKEMMLAALEARLRDMLGRQINVLNGTVGLAAVPEAQRTDKHRNRAVELARNEDEVALLASKVVTLLKEEGSSIAFPEALVQMRDDMITVTRRLERVDVGELTVGIEKDIVESLEEILEALQKEIEKAKDKKQQQQPGQPGQQQEQGLVDVLSELKMLRSLQYRVNRRTKQLGRMVEGEQASDPDLRQQLQGLSQRQAKIQQSTYNLATERNK